ncbi:MAG: magnesium transporter CorA family protein [Syntrophales bacterium]
MKLNEIKGNNFRWINIDHPSSESVGALAEVSPFHQLALEDCLSKNQLPKIDDYEDYLFIILHFPRYLKERRFSIPMQVAVFLGRDFLVTVHSGDLKPINRIFEACRDSEASRSNFMGQTSYYLVYRLILALVDNLLQMAAKVMSDIETLEEKVFDETVDAVREVTGLRHNIANLRRTIFPLKRVLHELERRIEHFSKDETMDVYFGDLSDSIDKVWEIIESCKEMSEIYKDTDHIISSDRTNKILTILTIVFTFSIPLTLIGTYYGMNVRIPGGLEDAPTFLGPYTTFIIIIAAGVLSVFGMLAVFRKFRWL